MQKVEAIKVLNIDGVPHDVDSMSEAVKSMVDIFNGWNNQEVDARDKLTMIQSAKNEVSRQIILQVRKEKEEEAGATEEVSGVEAIDDTVSDAE